MGGTGGRRNGESVFNKASVSVREDGKVLDDGGDVNVLNATDLCT